MSFIIDEYKNLIDQDLKKNLLRLLPKHDISTAYEYAVFPPGKLFRPLLVWSLAHDLSERELNYSSENCGLIEKNLSFLAFFTELHHAYSLVHDDLPFMDNDDTRRGKLSTHKKFGEWQALLVGDGLIISSFSCLSSIETPHLKELLKFVSWCTGPKGLIQGQVLDLNANDKYDDQKYKELLETHKLKTSRLFQVSLGGTYILLQDNLKLSTKHFLSIFRLGHHLGIIFQLLDDLGELTEKNISLREKKANLFYRYPQKSIKQTQQSLLSISKIINNLQLTNFKNVVIQYLEKSCNNLLKKSEMITGHIDIDIKTLDKLIQTLLDMVN